jgi:hypothetical protein
MPSSLVKLIRLSFAIVAALFVILIGIGAAVILPGAVCDQRPTEMPPTFNPPSTSSENAWRKSRSIQMVENNFQYQGGESGSEVWSYKTEHLHFEKIITRDLDGNIASEQDIYYGPGVWRISHYRGNNEEQLIITWGYRTQCDYIGKEASTEMAFDKAVASGILGEDGFVNSVEGEKSMLRICDAVLRKWGFSGHVFE